MTSTIKRKSSIKKSLKKNVYSRKRNSKTRKNKKHIGNMSGGVVGEINTKLLGRQEDILALHGSRLRARVANNIASRGRHSGINSSGSRSSVSSSIVSSGSSGSSKSRKNLGYGYELNLNTGTVEVNPRRIVNSMGYTQPVSNINKHLYVDMNAIAKHSNQYEVIEPQSINIDKLKNIQPSRHYVNIDPRTGEIYRSNTNSHYVNIGPHANNIRRKATLYRNPRYSSNNSSSNNDTNFDLVALAKEQALELAKKKPPIPSNRTQLPKTHYMYLPKQSVSVPHTPLPTKKNSSSPTKKPSPTPIKRKPTQQKKTHD